MKQMVTLIALLTLIGCGKADKAKAPKEDKAKTTPSAVAKLKNGDTIIGYILGFQEGWSLVHLSDEDRYVEINAETGAYRVYPTARSPKIYFAASDCQGDAIIEIFNGELGKTVLYTRDDRYFLVTGIQNYSQNKFLALSQLSLTRDAGYTPDSEICENLGGDEFDRIAGTVTETTQPYDFQSRAPLTIEYEGGN